jgi:hypothetical protein
MEMLLANEGACDDMTKKYLAEACARIAGVMGDKFACYLPRVVPPLLVRTGRRQQQQQ